MTSVRKHLAVTAEACFIALSTRALYSGYGILPVAEFMPLFRLRFGMAVTIRPLPENAVGKPYKGFHLKHPSVF